MQAGRVTNVVASWLEREAENRDPGSGDRAADYFPGQFDYS